MIHSSIQLDSTLTCGLWSAAMAVSLQRLGLERQTLTKSNAALLETGTCLLFLLPFFPPLSSSSSPVKREVEKKDGREKAKEKQKMRARRNR